MDEGNIVQFLFSSSIDCCWCVDEVADVSSAEACRHGRSNRQGCQVPILDIEGSRDASRDAMHRAARHTLQSSLRMHAAEPRRPTLPSPLVSEQPARQKLCKPYPTLALPPPPTLCLPRQQLSVHALVKRLVLHVVGQQVDSPLDIGQRHGHLQSTVKPYGSIIS